MKLISTKEVSEIYGIHPNTARVRFQEFRGMVGKNEYHLFYGSAPTYTMGSKGCAGKVLDLPFAHFMMHRDELLNQCKRRMVPLSLEELEAMR